MANADVLAVAALAAKAHKLTADGNYMRACDKQDGALAAARALPTCGDCLIEAHLLMRKWDIAQRVEEASASCGDADASHAASLAAFAAMFDEALPILERRAAAGTLDDTSHCPKEAVFYTALLPHIEPDLTPARAPHCASATIRSCWLPSLLRST
jgi:hypothetical protein